MATLGVRWRRAGHVERVVVHGDGLLLAGEDGIVLLDASSGDERWCVVGDDVEAYDLGVDGFQRLEVVDGVVEVVAAEQHLRLDATTGALIGRAEVEDPDWSHWTVQVGTWEAGPYSVTCTREGNEVRAIGSDELLVALVAQQSSFDFVQPTLAGDVLVVSTADGVLWGLAPDGAPAPVVVQSAPQRLGTGEGEVEHPLRAIVRVFGGVAQEAAVADLPNVVATHDLDDGTVPVRGPIRDWYIREALPLLAEGAGHAAHAAALRALPSLREPVRSDVMAAGIDLAWSFEVGHRPQGDWTTASGWTFRLWAIGERAEMTAQQVAVVGTSPGWTDGPTAFLVAMAHQWSHRWAALDELGVLLTAANGGRPAPMGRSSGLDEAFVRAAEAAQEDGGERFSTDPLGAWLDGLAEGTSTSEILAAAETKDPGGWSATLEAARRRAGDEAARRFPSAVGDALRGAVSAAACRYLLAGDLAAQIEVLRASAQEAVLRLVNEPAAGSEDQSG
jgi:hypothetical protein